MTTLDQTLPRARARENAHDNKRAERQNERVQRRPIRRGIGRRALLKALGAAGLATNAGCVTIASAVDDKRRKEGVHHIGNSTHLVVLDGVHVLTDPWVRDPADGILRHTSEPAPLPTKPDVVVVTHEHEDHFDETALGMIDKQAALVVPTWLEARAKKLGFAKLIGMKPGEIVDVAGVRIESVKAMHDVPEIAFRIQRGERAVFFGGDTLPTPEIEALAKRAPVDVAILPGNGGSLLGKRRVADEREAVLMATQLGCAKAKRGAILTHHEFEVSPTIPWALIVQIRPPDASLLPEWFKIPRAGEYFAWPWTT